MSARGVGVNAKKRAASADGAAVAPYPELQHEAKRQRAVWTQWHLAEDLLKNGGPGKYVQEMKTHMLCSVLASLESQHYEMQCLVSANTDLAAKVLALQKKNMLLLNSCFDKIQYLESGLLEDAETAFNRLVEETEHDPEFVEVPVDEPDGTDEPSAASGASSSSSSSRPRARFFAL